MFDPRHPHSPSERWASLVLAACDATADFKTLGRWAALAGVSQTSLSETCRLAGVRPHDARDFARLLRAIIRSHQESCSPSVLLDVSDSRTLRILLSRGGIAVEIASTKEPLTAAIGRFFERQRYVEKDNLGLRLVQSRFMP